MQNEDDTITLEPIASSKLALPALNNVQMSDVIFHVGVNKVAVYAHSIILSLQSEYFKALLYGPWSSAVSKNQQGNARCISLPEDDPEVFRRVVGFMYGEEVTMPTHYLFEVALSSKKYQISALETECERCLIRLMDIENACSMLNFALRCSMSQLEEESIEFICRNGDDILPYPRHLSCLDKEGMSLILERDELCIESEVKLFTVVVRWAQTKVGETIDPVCHTNSTVLKIDNPRTLYPLVSIMFGLIRFEQMTKKEMMEEIAPLGLVPSSLLEAAVQRQHREDVKIYERCYTKMNEEMSRAEKCSHCDTLFTSRSEHDFCDGSFFHPGYYCVFRNRWNCCDTTSQNGQGCTGRFHQWTPLNNCPTESTSLRYPATTHGGMDIVGFRTI
ncbi:hypothetical protein PROFUN_10304 [Planoprotostelium fungivorum]|uniref:BTB domain-containing protein n=1 Tax=Planoprotostelium fungivorum TaxID=1890364 RepID=A0A2P6MRV4_9EUKA|nr:hypothetical protein PROFUN_10304 [Planoprotostelium fungivorum]